MTSWVSLLKFTMSSTKSAPPHVSYSNPKECACWVGSIPFPIMTQPSCSKLLFPLFVGPNSANNWNQLQTDQPICQSTDSLSRSFSLIDCFHHFNSSFFITRIRVKRKGSAVYNASGRASVNLLRSDGPSEQKVWQPVRPPHHHRRRRRRRCPLPASITVKEWERERDRHLFGLLPSAFFFFF